MRKSIKASKYIEVSSKTRNNLEECFKTAVELVLQQRIESEGPAATTAAADGEDVPNASPRRTPKRKSVCSLL